MTHQANQVPCISAHFKLLSLMVVLLALGGTQGVDGARNLRADADAVYSVWDPSDICGQPVRQSTGDQLGLTCAGCLERPGCAIESTTGKCVSVARINTTVDVEYLIAGQTHYCDDIDNANSLCGADNTTSVPVCRGTKGCVSVHQCEVAAAIAVPLSSSESSFRVYYVLIGGALLATAVLMMRLYKSLSSDVMSAFDRRMRARRTHTAKPLTMKLDGWRGFIAKEREEQSENIEIKLCPARASEDTGAAATGAQIMNDYEAQRNHSAVSTEEGDDESKDRDVEYVAVTTPRNGSGDVAGEHSRRL